MKICAYCSSPLDEYDCCTNPDCIANQDTEPPKKKRKTGKIIGRVILIVFLVSIAFGVYKVVTNPEYYLNKIRNLSFVQEILHDNPTNHYAQNTEKAQYTELKSYLGTKIGDVSGSIESVTSKDSADNTVEYGNQWFSFKAEQNSDDISAIYLFEKCSYCVYDIHIGMKFADAEKILEDAGFKKSGNRADETEFTNKSDEKVVLVQNFKQIAEIDLFKTDGTQKGKPDDTVSEISESGSFSRANSSSTLDPMSGYNYYASNVLDDDPTTCWAEGAYGTGIGETIILRSDDNVKVKGLRINNGYCKSEKLYKANNRLKEIKVTFSDGSSENFTLEDGYTNRTAKLDFSKEISTKQIKIEIVSVYKGTDYADTCVSDIIAY